MADNMTLVYALGDKLYLNITNRCHCACTFCIRQEGDGVGDGDNLWLKREPSAGEVIADIKKRELRDYREVVFCGYGEPTENLPVLLEVAGWLKANAAFMPVRLNTNGLADLYHDEPVAPRLKGLIDIVSISLNAPDAVRYTDVTRPQAGEKAFDAMLRFAKDCKGYLPQVVFSVVDVLPEAEIAECQKLCDSVGIPLRVRQFS